MPENAWDTHAYLEPWIYLNILNFLDFELFQPILWNILPANSVGPDQIAPT